MFGRPWYDPVDDLPDPPEDIRDPLDILGADFRLHNCSLHRLIRVIASTHVFQLESMHPTQDQKEFHRLKDEWAVFPLVRLRPEQVIGSMLQAGYVRTIDRNSHLFVRFQRFTSEAEFVRDYGDLGDNELVERAGTIPQALLRMNGNFTQNLTETRWMAAAGRILALSGSEEQTVENCFLACLTRRPGADERDHFVKRLSHTRLGTRDHLGQKIGQADLPESVSQVFYDVFAEGWSLTSGWHHESGGEFPFYRIELTVEDQSRWIDVTSEGELMAADDGEFVQDLYWSLFNAPEFSWNH